MLSQRNYRLLSLATAFVAGYMVVVLYFPTVHQSANFSSDRSDWQESPNVSYLRQHGLVQNIPDEDTLKTFTVEKLIAIFHSFLDNVDVICHRKLRMGRIHDGGWEICDDYEWRPIVPCIIYSFGINYDFGFDDDSGRLYGCDVYSFDPSMAHKTFKRTERVMFYSIGIGNQSGETVKTANGWLLHSFSNIRQMLKHTQSVIDVLKMDVEGAEWSALKTMVAERQLDSVRQLLVEFHEYTNSGEALLGDLAILRELEKAGFRRFYVSKNIYCQRRVPFFPLMRTSCYEVHFINVNLRRLPA